MLFIVTGATGFIGRRVVRLLVERGHEVRSLGRVVADARVVSHRLDLLANDVHPPLNGVAGATILHLAWYAVPRLFWTAPENLDWLAASLRLVRSFAAHGGARFVGAGTCAEYEWGDGPLEEGSTLLRPSTLYGTAKASLFTTLEKAAPALGIELAWARIFNPYGPDEAPQRLLGSVIAAARGTGTPDFSSGFQKRDFMHVDDVARALVELAESGIQGPVNVASGEARSVREFVEAAARVAGIERTLRFGSNPLGAQDVPIIAASTRRLHDELGFRPSFSFEHGIGVAVRDGLADLATSA